MIKLNDVTFFYNDDIVLDTINLELKAGHIYGLIGSNGSGKTTLLGCLGNTMRPNYGSISYKDKDITNNLNYIRDTMLLDSNFYVGGFNALSLVTHLSKNKGVKYNKDYFVYLLNRFNIDFKVPIRKFSKGNKRLAYLAAVLSLDLKVLILDEFIDGIDIINRKQVKEELIHYINDKDRLIIIASHTTSDINDVCDSVILLSESKVKRNCTIEELKALYVTFQVVLKNNLNVDDLGLNGLEIFRYRSFENIRWLTISNDDKQKQLLRMIDSIETKQLTTSLEEVIFNEFSL